MVLGFERSIVVGMLVCMASVAPLWAATEEQPATELRPNIVVILADDLGYGDLGCYGATKVKTPNVDRLAREGRLFTDAHSPAAVCTPTRYALMTGREFFRYGRRWNKECLVAPGQITLASLCKEFGYATALVGKWHLGYGEKEPDWNGELKPGPLECGFDSFFGTAMTHNEPPQVLVDGHRVVGLSKDDPIRMLPPDAKHPFGVRQGGTSALLTSQDLCDLHTQKAVQFIDANKDRPFFLYYGMINVHVPLSPAKRFQGSSGIGTYGDYIQELDWSVGEVLATLDKHQLSERTLVILTSDNGGVLHRQATDAGHLANGELLGQKTDVWEGGHRVPFVVRWPGHTPAETKCGDLICLTDMLATFAAIFGRELQPGEGPDSLNVLPAILDQPHNKSLRPFATIIGTKGVGIRDGKWVFLAMQGSGGATTEPKNAWFQHWSPGWQNSDFTADGTLKPDAPPGQLYDLRTDPRETTNLYEQHPQVVERLQTLLKQVMKKGASARAIAADFGEPAHGD
jgi:arylsulfatase A